MAVLFVFLAVAHECDVPRPCQSLQKPERELLAVVLYRRILQINRTICEYLLSVTPHELSPTDLLPAERSKQPFAWTQVRHPYIIA